MIKSNQISVIYGDKPKVMVKEILNLLRPEEGLDKNALIGIKPNLVVAKPASSGATTSPELVAGLIEYLNDKGYRNLVILEGSWVGDRTSAAFRICGYEALSKRYNIPLIDLQKDNYKEYEHDGVKISICDSVMKLDYLINLPVLKGHCQTNMTCALKNMKGCIPDSEKRRFHAMGLHKPIAYLNRIKKADLVIVDGLNGDLNFEEGGNPVQMNRVIVGSDPVLIDAYAAQLMGFSLEDVPYIKIAESLGVGSTDLVKAEITELNKDSGVTRITTSRRAQQLAKYVVEDSACSACYGSLMHALERFNERGLLGRLKTKIYIGQNFKGKQPDGIGIGACTSKCDRCVPGCPPTAMAIVEYLEKNL